MSWQYAAATNTSVGFGLMGPWFLGERFMVTPSGVRFVSITSGGAYSPYTLFWTSISMLLGCKQMASLFAGATIGKARQRHLSANGLRP